MRELMHRISLDQLIIFVSLVETDSFVATGKRLGRSQSAITQQLSKLEKTVGAPLILRTRGRVQGLTEIGKQVLPYAQNSVRAVEIFYNSTRNKTQTGQIRIGTTDDYNIDNLQLIIEKLATHFPYIDFSVFSDFSGHLETMFPSILDIILTKELSTENATVEGQFELECQQLVWIRGSSFALSSEAKKLPLVLLNDGCSYRRIALDALNKNEIDYEIRYSGTSYFGAMQAIRQGFGIGVFPERYCDGTIGVELNRYGDVILPSLPTITAMLRYNVEKLKGEKQELIYVLLSLFKQYR
ncbi:LysR family transcriptional regulator [Bartonella sp. LJL80]